MQGFSGGDEVGGSDDLYKILTILRILFFNGQFFLSSTSIEGITISNGCCRAWGPAAKRMESVSSQEARPVVYSYATGQR